MKRFYTICSIKNVTEFVCLCFLVRKRYMYYFHSTFGFVWNFIRNEIAFRRKKGKIENLIIKKMEEILILIIV